MAELMTDDEHAIASKLAADIVAQCAGTMTNIALNAQVSALASTVEFVTEDAAQARRLIKAVTENLWDLYLQLRATREFEDSKPTPGTEDTIQ